MSAEKVKYDWNYFFNQPYAGKLELQVQVLGKGLP